MRINVKAHGICFPEGGTDAEREQAYRIATDRWWHTAQGIADAHGVGVIYQDGRSGGWLDAPGADGHPNAEDFEAAIKEHLQRAPDIFGEALTEITAITAKANAVAAGYEPEPPEGYTHAYTEVSTRGYIIVTYRPLP